MYACVCKAVCTCARGRSQVFVFVLVCVCVSVCACDVCAPSWLQLEVPFKGKEPIAGMLTALVGALC